MSLQKMQAAVAHGKVVDSRTGLCVTAPSVVNSTYTDGTSFSNLQLTSDSYAVFRAVYGSRYPCIKHLAGDVSLFCTCGNFKTRLPVAMSKVVGCTCITTDSAGFAERARGAQCDRMVLVKACSRGECQAFSWDPKFSDPKVFSDYYVAAVKFVVSVLGAKFPLELVCEVLSVKSVSLFSVSIYVMCSMMDLNGQYALIPDSELGEVLGVNIRWMRTARSGYSLQTALGDKFMVYHNLYPLVASVIRDMRDTLRKSRYYCMCAVDVTFVHDAYKCLKNMVYCYRGTNCSCNQELVVPYTLSDVSDLITRVTSRGNSALSYDEFAPDLLELIDCFWTKRQSYHVADFECATSRDMSLEARSYVLGLLPGKFKFPDERYLIHSVVFRLLSVFGYSNLPVGNFTFNQFLELPGYELFLRLYLLNRVTGCYSTMLDSCECGIMEEDWEQRGFDDCETPAAHSVAGVVDEFVVTLLEPRFGYKSACAVYKTVFAHVNTVATVRIGERYLDIADKGAVVTNYLFALSERKDFVVCGLKSPYKCVWDLSKSYSNVSLVCRAGRLYYVRNPRSIPTKLSQCNLSVF